ncbi:Phosphoribosylamine--glycine ligase OS=Streptomyces tendae OX=1932 GN=GUR47_21930 PE=4 SV=1 [Streptomyces tendae]
MAGEADRYFPRTALPEHDERVLLAHCPYTDVEAAPAAPRRRRCTGPVGRLGLHVRHVRLVPGPGPPGHVDPRVQRATANLLDRICKRD